MLRRLPWTNDVFRDKKFCKVQRNGLTDEKKKKVENLGKIDSGWRTQFIPYTLFNKSESQNVNC